MKTGFPGPLGAHRVPRVPVGRQREAGERRSAEIVAECAGKGGVIGHPAPYSVLDERRWAAYRERVGTGPDRRR